ncbi:MAG: hypothetical protein ACE5F9_13645 [Phycisphaerae bacterium]
MASLRLAGLSLFGVVLAFQPTAVSGGLITFPFSGDFSAPTDFNGLNAATTFSGAYTFESLTPDGLPGDPTFGDYAAVTSFSLNIGAFTFSSASISFGGITVIDSVPDDYEVTLSGANVVGDIVDASLLFSDIDGTVFSSDALPLTPPNLTLFESAVFAATITPSGEFSRSVQGTITSVLPEPATLSLLLALVPVAARRRRT